MVLKIALLAVFFGVMIGIGLYCRKNATDVNGFVLGGRSVGPWLTAFAFGTSYFSAVIFVGYAGQFGWKYGVSATWVGIGNALVGSLLAWVILGRRTRIMTQHLDSATMPQFFAARYGSPSLKIAASIITFIFLIPYTASLYNGLSRLFHMAFPGVSYEICVIAMAALTAVYVIAGGYFATAINDFVQGIVMLFGISAVVIAVLNVKGGFLNALAQMGEVTEANASTALAASPGVFASFFGPDPVNLLGVVLLTSLGTWGLPQMVQKFYAIKSEKSIGTGTVVSTAFAFIVAGGCYFLGGFGRLFADKIEVGAKGIDFDSVVPAMLDSLNADWIIAVVLVLVLSASMSTLSSLVLTSSSTLTLDLVKGHIVKDMKEKSQVLLMRLLIVVFIVISAVIAILQYQKGIAFIAQLMGVSWGALAGAFLAPFLYGLYWKKTTKAACWVSFLFSTLVMLANMLFRSAFPALLQSPINAGAFCMIAGLVLVPLVSLVTPKPKKELVEDAFACYNEKVLVPQYEALGEAEPAGE